MTGGQRIDPVSWAYEVTWSDARAHFENQANPGLAPRVVSFYKNKKGKEWFEDHFTKDGMKASADIVKSEVDSQLVKDSVGTDRTILATASRMKKGNMEVVRNKRVPKTKMKAPLAIPSKRLCTKMAMQEDPLPGPEPPIEDIKGEVFDEKEAHVKEKAVSP